MSEVYPKDMKVHPEERDIQLDETNDLSITNGFDVVEQGLALDTSDAIRDVLGRVIQGRSIRRLEQNVRETLLAQPYVETLVEVSVTEVDKANDVVKMRIRLTHDEEFQVELTP